MDKKTSEAPTPPAHDAGARSVALAKLIPKSPKGSMSRQSFSEALRAIAADQD